MVKFQESPKINYPNQAIINYLRNRKFYFEKINDYDNERFYCMVSCEIIDNYSNLFKKKVKNKIFKLSLISCEQYNSLEPEPLIFTREEVVGIIEDCSESCLIDKCLENGIEVSSENK